MTSDRIVPGSEGQVRFGDTPPGHWPLLRWFAASAMLNMPQASGPVAFSLLALSLIDDASGGAAMMLAMTLAQVVGAIPLTRLARRLPVATTLRMLLVFRTLALAALVLCAQYKASFAWLVFFAALAGSVNGAAFGYLRTLLNHLTPASRLPRALGIASTLNELTFVLAPVTASGLGTVSPVLAVLVLTILGAIPALLIPQVGSPRVTEVPHVQASLLNRAIVLWLTCAAAGSATVAAIEIGAVALAMKFGHAAALAILFTVPLCLASVAGGLWVSVRNRLPSRKMVLAQLSIMTLGSALAAFGPSLASTILAAIMIGFVLPSLGTYYSLVLDKLAPPQKQPEVFALLRTSNAIGIIIASAVLTAASVTTALILATGVMIVVTSTVGLYSMARAGR